MIYTNENNASGAIKILGGKKRVANPYMVRYLTILTALDASREGHPFVISDIIKLANRYRLEISHRSNVWEKLERMADAGILERLTPNGYGKGRITGVRYQLGTIALTIFEKEDIKVHND